MKLSSMGRLQGLVFFCLAAAATAAAAADTYFTAEAGLSYDSNIARAERSLDINDDFALEAGLSAARSFRLNDRSGIVIRAGADWRQQFNYDGLSRLQLAAGARYRIQPVPGYTNPWIELALDASRLDYRDSAIRDGWQWDTGVTVGKYFTDRLRLTAGWNYQQRSADDDGVFDWRHHSLNFSADYRFSDATTLYASASRIYGDQVSTVKYPASIGNYDAFAKAVVRDRALEQGAGDEHRAYRIDAHSNVFEFGLNHVLQAGLSLDLSVQHYTTDTAGGHRYDGSIGRAGLLYRF